MLDLRGRADMGSLSIINKKEVPIMLGPIQYSTQTIERAIDNLTAAIDRASDASEKHAKSLTTATWVLGVATVVLAIATIVNIFLQIGFVQELQVYLY